MKFNFKNIFVCFFLSILFFTNCSKDDNKKFRLIPSSESGITFRNELKESLEFNIFNYMYFYNGAGVAVGDVNGDDLLDIYFTSNQNANKLYLNKGEFKFDDITEQAGVEGFKGWATGVTMADVNNDGRLDIYVSYVGDYLIYKGRNKLFINEGNDEQGIPHFKERGMEFGLDLVGFSTQASFFDYDRDGDLDMFMLNHSLHENGTFAKSYLRTETHPLAGDKLLQNDNGRFIDVTKNSGIYSSALGYGLGVVISDVNLDGWPDIYVGNDFHENDYLYINQKDGTFKEVLEKSMNHTSRYTMGVDFADFNNDAFPDLISMDMLPENPLILKASAAEDNYDVFSFKLNYGYNYQYSRNTLQLNNHDGTFSEIGLFAGVSATDWSWSTLFSDFDLDGRKDIFVANGIVRRSNDLDYINFISVDSIQMKMKFQMTKKELTYLNMMPNVKMSNYLYVNNGDSTFTNKSSEWGLDKLSYSNGAAYADFDNDGDLDLVTNNVEDEAFLYENRTLTKIETKEKAVSNHYLQVALKGNAGNRFGIGTKVFLYNKSQLQVQECMPTRGYESSVDYRLTFGLGQTNKIDSVIIVWPDGTFEKITDLKTDQRLTAEQKNASGSFNYEKFHRSTPLLQDVTATTGITFKHHENKFVEFNREALLPHMLSAEGPACAVADVNGDGHEDVYLGGAKWQQGTLWLWSKTGTFKLSTAFSDVDSTYEDVDAEFVDVDNDNDNDLIVVSGGNEFSGDSKYLMSRLYMNDGKGNFSVTNNLPEIRLTGSSVSAADVDNDGDTDLFIGARSIPWKYGIKPDSYLLLNDGKGVYKDVTKSNAPSLHQLGFVKNSEWTDVDNDHDPDLIIAGEWMPITIFINTKGVLSPLKLEGSGLENSNGWWNEIYPADFDGDGDIDFIAGNLGLNSKLHASLKEPVKLYVNDFDKNGTVEQVLTHFIDGKEYPFYTREEMTKQLPGLKKRFLSYRKYAEATIHEIFPKDTLECSDVLSAYMFESQYIENLGGGKFKMKPLPKAAQFSTLNSIETNDFNGDGKLDALIAGNFYPTNIQMGRYDASYGLLLQGDGKGNFKSIPSVQSGFSITGEVRHLKKLKVAGKDYFIAVRNNDTVKAFAVKK
ncbi:MAG TPA: VCBS repeat-containing protein [Cyclobacteriaceae bacterium]